MKEIEKLLEVVKKLPKFWDVSLENEKNNGYSVIIKKDDKKLIIDKNGAHPLNNWKGDLVANETISCLNHMIDTNTRLVHGSILVPVKENINYRIEIEMRKRLNGKFKVKLFNSKFMSTGMDTIPTRAITKAISELIKLNIEELRSPVWTEKDFKEVQYDKGKSYTDDIYQILYKEAQGA